MLNYVQDSDRSNPQQIAGDTDRKFNARLDEIIRTEGYKWNNKRL